MNLPLKTAVSVLCAKQADFNLVHFRDAAQSGNAPAHFWVSVSVGDNQHLLLSIVTSRMATLEQKYINSDKEAALDYLVPLSSSDFKNIKTPCVINCNDTMLLSTEELTGRIDTTYHNAKSKRSFDFVHYDKDFDPELKDKIISAILNSPLTSTPVKECAEKIRKMIR